MDAIGTPNAFNPGPPLYDPVRQILVHYDTIGRQVAAHAYGGPGSLDLLWTLPFCNTVQMMLYPDTGELVLEDSPHALTSGGDFKDGAVVVVDIETGEEKGRKLPRYRCHLGWNRLEIPAIVAGRSADPREGHHGNVSMPGLWARLLCFLHWCAANQRKQTALL